MPNFSTKMSIVRHKKIEEHVRRALRDEFKKLREIELLEAKRRNEIMMFEAEQIKKKLENELRLCRTQKAKLIKAHNDYIAASQWEIRARRDRTKKQEILNQKSKNFQFYQGEKENRQKLRIPSLRK